MMLDDKLLTQTEHDLLHPTSPKIQVEITQAYLHECLTYDPDTGVVQWRERPLHHFNWVDNQTRWNGAWAGKVVGSVKPCGKVIINLNGKTYRVDKLAHMYMLGRWSKEYVRHIDGDKTNNRWGNLKEASFSEISLFRKTANDNTSGHKGVAPVKNRGNQKWRAMLTVKKVTVLSRHFIHKKDAIAARAQARIDHGLDPD